MLCVRVNERVCACVSSEQLKQMTQAEKEARLLVATWQSRDNEVNRIYRSGRPQPRTDCTGVTRGEAVIKWPPTPRTAAKLKIPEKDHHLAG